MQQRAMMVVASAPLVLLILSYHVMGQQCPSLTSIFPPSGLRNKQAFQITGENLDGVVAVNSSSGTVTTTAHNDTMIIFTIDTTGTITISLEPTDSNCVTHKDTIDVKGPNVNFDFGSNLEGQPGTVFFIEGCFPDICGDNSTSYSVRVGGVEAELLDESQFGEQKMSEFQFYMRLGQISSAIPQAVVTVTSQYGTEYDSSNTISYQVEGSITSVSPSTGQRGTEVSITGTNLIGLNGNLDISLAEASLGGIPAEILNATQSLVILKAATGSAGLTGVEMNSTQLSLTSNEPLSGPSISVSGLWTYLEDGLVTQLVPPAAQEGSSISVCGSSVLGGGTSIFSVSVVSVDATSFSSGLENLSAVPDDECVTVTVPAPLGPLPQEGGINITANTKALVTTADGVTFKYANISLLNPNKGQEQTFVTITGLHLLSGYNETEVSEPIVTLGSTQASVISYSESEIVVQVQPPAMPSLEIDNPSDVKIIVAKFGLNFTVELANGWTYLQPGSITSAEPSFGQVGTRVTLNGTNLLGYGISFDYVSILGSDSGSVDTDPQVNATLVEFNDTTVVIDIPSPFNSSYVGPVDVLLVADNGAQIQGTAVFQYLREGNITAVSPSEGQRGTYVTINGTNLFGHGGNITEVQLGDAIAEILYDRTTDSSIYVRAAELVVTETTPIDITLISITNAKVVTTNQPFSYLQEGNITTVIPDVGQIGTVVNITGAGLLGGGSDVEKIVMDGVEPASISSYSDSKIVLTLGDHAARDPELHPGEVYIESDTGATVIGGLFTQMPPGNITSVLPTEGRVGTEITLTGYNLTGYGNYIETVFVGDYRVSVSMAFEATEGDTMLVIEAPDAPSGHSGPIKLIIDTGATITSTQTFTFIQPGTIVTVTPVAGAEGRGVLINGINLIVNNLKVTGVTIGGSEVTRIVTESSSQISFIAGPSPNGNLTDLPIRVTLSDGSFTEGGAFTYEDYLLDINGRREGQLGTNIELEVPFPTDNILFVKFDGVEATIVETDSVNSTITVETPRALILGNHSVDITVEDTDNNIARLKDGFTYLTEGYICTVSPPEGQRGTRVKISGENLLGGGSEITEVTFGDVSARVESYSNVEVNVSLSDNSVSYPKSVDVRVVSDTSATTTILDGFTFIEPGSIASVIPSSGQFGTLVTITGMGLLEGDQELVSVKLAGVEADIVGTPNDTVVMVAAGASNASTGQVSVITSTGAEILSDQFEYLVPGTITSISPTNGTEGTRVKIYGQNMLGGGTSVSTVQLGGVEARVVDGDDSVITVDAVGGGNSSAPPSDIVVTSNTGSMVTLKEVWVFTEPGNISSVFPASGQQGVNVTIEGTAILGSSEQDNITYVELAGFRASVIEQSGTKVIVEAGYSDIESVSGPAVIKLDSGPVITSSVNFSYYTASLDQVVPINGTNGTYIMLEGVNIVGEPNTTFNVSSVTLGGIPCYDIQTISQHSVQVRAGFSDDSVSMVDVVITSSSGAFLVLEEGWSYLSNGEIQAVEPSSAAPGENVTITGMRLVPSNATSVTVTFGKTDAFSAYIVNTSMIVARVGVYSSPDEPGVDVPLHIVANDGSTVVSDSNLFSFKSTSIGDSVTPYAGQTGTMVSVNGSDLFDRHDGPVDVYLAGVLAQIIEFTSTVVTVTAGSGPEEGISGSVTIVIGNRTFTGLGGSAWTYLPHLTANHVTPLSGRNGTTVTIDTSSVPTTFVLQSVYLGDIQADVVSETSDNVQLSVRHYDKASGVENITLNYQDDISLVITDSWSYQPPASIQQQNSTLEGYYNGQVVINGAGLRGGDADVPIASVTLAGFDTEITTQTNTELVVRITDNYDSSTGSVVGPIVITSDDGASYYSTSSDNINFTYIQVRVDSVSPVQGQNGTRVSISGVGLLAGSNSVDSATLAGVEVAAIEDVSDTTVVVSAAGYDNVTGPGDIQYTVGSGAIVSIMSSWSYLALGEIDTVTPVNGSKGTVVNIIGERLLGGGSKADLVYLNGVEALEVLVSNDKIVQVRAGGSDPKMAGEIMIVADTGATLTSTRNELSFEYIEPGRIDIVYPLSGQFGTIVTVTGVDLHKGEGISIVTIAGVEAVVTSYNSTTVNIVAQRPPTTSSFMGLVVVESDHRMLVESSVNFTYLREGDITAVVPSQGQYQTQVTISGNRLYGGGNSITSVVLAGVAADIVSQSDMEVVITANESVSSTSQDINGDIVLTSDSGAQVSLIDSWTYVQVGLIYSVSPQSGQYGTRVNITGERLTAGGTSVKKVVIGDTDSLEVLSSSDTEVIFRTGNPVDFDPFSATIKLVSNDNGEIASEMVWNYTAASQINDVTPENGTGGSIITIAGLNLLGGDAGLNVSTVEIVGISVNRVVSQSDTLIVVEVGFNPDGQEKEGDIMIETTSGSIVFLEAGWVYLNECPIGQFGNNTNSCSLCNTECEHCYGPTDYDCYSCKNFKILMDSQLQCVAKCPSLSTLDNVCVNSCGTDQYEETRLDDNRYCIDCHQQCNPNLGCTGNSSTLSHCTACRNVELDGVCIESCPVGYFVQNGSVCTPCNDECVPEAGCRGEEPYNCNQCRNVTIFKQDQQVDECVPSCPSGYFTDSNEFCQICHSLCLGGCDGPLASDCHQCRNATFVDSFGTELCVESCNKDPDYQLYYMNSSTGYCVRCHEFCSLTSGCVGPSTSNCIKCLNFTGNNNNANEFLPRFDGKCVMDCPNNSYYIHLVRGSCERCHSNCTLGCTGPAVTDCIEVSVSATVMTTPTEETTGHFAAGAGTIGLVVGLFVVLILIMVIIIVVLACAMVRGKKNAKGSYSFAGEMENPSLQMRTTEFSRNNYMTAPGNQRASGYITPTNINPVFGVPPASYIDTTRSADPTNAVSHQIDTEVELSQTMSEAYMEMEYNYQQQQQKDGDSRRGSEQTALSSVPPPTIPPKPASGRLSSSDPPPPQLPPKPDQKGYNKPPPPAPPKELTFIEDTDDVPGASLGVSCELLTQEEYEEPFVALSRLPPPPAGLPVTTSSSMSPPATDLGNIYEVELDEDHNPDALYEDTSGIVPELPPQLPTSFSLPQVPPALPERQNSQGPPIPSRARRPISTTALQGQH